MSQNRFAGLNAAKRVSDGKEQAQNAAPIAETPKIEEKKRGRPAGKRTNPEFRQLTIFVRNDTLDRVKIALIKEKGEVSELVEQLFLEWLERKP